MVAVTVPYYGASATMTEVDHPLLDDVEGLENPTAEIIARCFLGRIQDCQSVRVHENDDCWADVTR